MARKPNLSFRDYPKGDTRRYLCILAAIHLNGNSASIGEIVETTGCNRAEAQRTIALLENQFGVEWGKSGLIWYVRSFGILNIGLVVKLLCES